MENAPQERADYIQRLLHNKPKPRNQVAAISGLSNAYIRELERGAFANVGRQKIIALAVALDLTLNETDNLLALFDRPSLTTADIPKFLNIANRAKISSALYPIHNYISLLILFSHVEQIPGRLTIVVDRPTDMFRPPQYEASWHRLSEDSGSISVRLVEAITRRRTKCISMLLDDYPVDQYICREIMDAYISDCVDDAERKWRIKHIENLIYYLDHYENFSIYLTTVTPRFYFSIKTSAYKEKETDKLLFVGKLPKALKEANLGRLAGFVTDNQIIIQSFTYELDFIKDHILDQYLDRQELKTYLETLISGAQNIE